MKILNIICIVAIAITPLNISAQKPPSKATPVFVAKVLKEDFFDEVEALGTLRANESVNLTPSVTELVTKVNFEDGNRVEKGDVLVEMEMAEELALKIEEEYRLKEAKRQVSRLEPLVKRGAASRSVLDTQKLEVETSKARLRAIESQIRQRQIIAPFNGVLGQRNISVGSLTQPSAVVTTIDDDSVMKLDFSVPELFIPELTKIKNIKAKTRTWPDELFEGNILSINSRVDPITRSVLVRATINNDANKLRAGMLMRVKINKNLRKALIIPEEAVISRASKNYLFVVDEKDGKTTAQEKQVKLGTRKQGVVEILGGVDEGQLVVIHGTLRIRNGSEVDVKATEEDNETLQELLKKSDDKNE